MTGTGVRLMALVGLLAATASGAAGCGADDPAIPPAAGAATPPAAGATASPAAGAAASSAGDPEVSAGAGDPEAPAGAATDPSAAAGAGGDPEAGLPPGKTCAEVAEAIADATGIAWQRPAGTGDPAGPGERRCTATAGSRKLQVTLYRPDWPADTPEKLLGDARKRSGGCATDVPAPVDGVGYATSCVDRTVATTTLVVEAGWVVVSVSAQDETVTFTQRASRKGAVSALSLI